MKNIYFGRRIEPACEYCELGSPTKDGQMILCRKNGVVAPCFSCRKFTYDPLLRTPEAPAGFSGGSFDPDDFAL